MERYLLFDSGCGLCSKIAAEAVEESNGWLEAKSLRNKEFLTLVLEAKPNWHWEPTLLEIENGEVTVSTGITLTAKIVRGLGVKKAWQLAKLIQQAKGTTSQTSESRRNFLRRGGAMLATIPLLGGLNLRQMLPASSVEYQTYQDPDFDFSLEVPQGWIVDVKEEQPRPLIDDEAILKRVIFSGQPALVYLDIWLTKGKQFEEWLSWYKETREVEQMPVKANAIVAGKTGVTFLHEQQRDLMITYFSDGEYVYRLLNWMTNEQSHLDSYWRMLESFRLSRDIESVGLEIPLGIKQYSPQLKAATIIKAAQYGHCCGHNDSGNPFYCCGCEYDCCCTEQEGNCTWWVYYKHTYVPFTGDAGTWWGDALNYSNWHRSSYPPTNGDMSIACYSHGHVAHASSWSGVGQVSITEMSWCDFCDRTENIDAHEPTQGWLYDNAV